MPAACGGNGADRATPAFRAVNVLAGLEMRPSAMRRHRCRQSVWHPCRLRGWGRKSKPNVRSGGEGLFEPDEIEGDAIDGLGASAHVLPPGTLVEADAAAGCPERRGGRRASRRFQPIGSRRPQEDAGRGRCRGPWARRRAGKSRRPGSRRSRAGRPWVRQFGGRPSGPRCACGNSSSSAAGRGQRARGHRAPRAIPSPKGRRGAQGRRGGRGG